MDNVIGVILGGGMGTRLYPLTKERAKPAVPLGGKYRLVDIPVSNCIHSQVKKIYVITQYSSESLNRSIHQTYIFDIFSKGYIRVLAAEQSIRNREWLQGTADAIRKNIQHITSDRNAEYIIILSGDQLYRMDYRKILKRHISSQADVTLALTTVPKETASHFGLAKICKSGDITAFVEKPENGAIIEDFLVPDTIKAREGLCSEEDYVLANMGIYVFSKRFLCELMESTSEDDFGKHIIPNLLGKKKLTGFVHHDYWEDIGTIKAFYEANINLASATRQFDFFDMDRPVYAQPLFLPPSQMMDCSVKNSLVSDGCIIYGASIKNSLVGIRSIVQKKCTIEEAVIMGADYYESEIKDNKPSVPMGIGENCTIRRAILDKNVHIGNDVHIINKYNVDHEEGNGYCIKDGIVVVEKGATIPDGMVI